MRARGGFVAQDAFRYRGKMADKRAWGMCLRAILGLSRSCDRYARAGNVMLSDIAERLEDATAMRARGMFKQFTYPSRRAHLPSPKRAQVLSLLGNKIRGFIHCAAKATKRTKGD